MTIDEEHVNKSPYPIELSRYLDGRYKNYIKSNEYGAEFFEDYILNINRKKFFETLVKNFPKDQEKRSKTYIFYEDEPGLDQGGLTKDFFECLGTYAQNPVFKLFQKQGDHYKIHPESNPKRMEVFGSAIANGIIHKYKIPISLCDSLIKILLDLPLSAEDLIKESPEYYNNLSQILEYSSKDLEEVYQNFTICQGNNTINLKPNGNNIYLNIENSKEYYDLSVNWELKKYAEKSIDEFRRGFLLVAKPMTKVFSVDEFRYIMCGMDPSYTEVLAEKIKCSSRMGKQKEWLIRWIKEREDLEDVKRFLKFVTGTSLIPVGKANWEIKLKLNQKEKNNDNALPIAHTCFNTIEMPDYSSYEILSEKMKFLVSTNIEEGFDRA